MEIVRVDPRDRVLFARWHSALRDGRLAGRPPVPFFSLAEFRELHTDVDTLARRGRVALAALAEGDVVGAAEVEFPHRWDTDTAPVTVSVPPDRRRRGVGSALWERVEHEIDAVGRTTIETEVDVPVDVRLADTASGSFALARGFVSANAEEHCTLALPFDAGPIPEKPGYRFTTWLGRCPDQHVEAYALMQTVMAADVPHGDVRREQRSYTVDDVRDDERSLAARGFGSLTTIGCTDGRHLASGEPAGYSVMYVSGHDVEHVHQDDTLVARAHRGHGLGVSLKLRNHRLLGEQHPERRIIHTWTELNNAPMQRVNRHLGYRPVEINHEMTRGR